MTPATATSAVSVSPSPDFVGFVAESPAMHGILALLRHVARARATVLITGESGTGKELLARYLHESAGDPRAPFVAVNCAAIPESLLESELFGHERGAFTGASSRRMGRFEQADGGTLLLDEIGEMDPRLQAKLLRVLQERVFERVGGTTQLRVSLRVVATTNRDLRRAVADGIFREDLFYRLNVIPVAVPPLRERTEEILPLARMFAATTAEENGFPAPRLTVEAEAYLLRQKWPGNVRELRNRVERAVLCTPGGILDETSLGEPGEASFITRTPSTTPVVTQKVAVAVSPSCSSASVRDMEKAHILSTLRRLGGQRNRTAEELGISVRTLRNKISIYRLDGEAI